jgi:predicted transcriptional regulator
MQDTLSAKRASLRLIERLDEDVTYDDIIYELYFLRKIERGVRDVEEGRTATQEEVKEEFGRWLS